MKSAYLLVDYFNVIPAGHQQSENFKDHLNDIEKFVSSIANWNQRSGYAFSEINLKLYGGWTTNEIADQTPIRQITGAISKRFFPIRSKHTRITIANEDSSITTPGTVFPSMKRIQNGIGWIKRSSSCPVKDINCPIEAIQKMKNGKCTNYEICHANMPDLIHTTVQKMVDTAIVADTIYLIVNTDDHIFPVSNDDDILLASMASRAISDRTGILRYNKQRPSVYDYILDDLLVYSFNLT